MPWSASSFSSRHNKKLHGEAAEKAAKVATGLVAKGEPEGKAIRIANALGDKIEKKRRMRDIYKRKKA